MSHEYKSMSAHAKPAYNEEMSYLYTSNQDSHVSDEYYVNQNTQKTAAQEQYTPLQDKPLPHRPAPLPKEGLFRGLRRYGRLALWGLAMSCASIMTGYEEVFTAAITGVPAFQVIYGVPTTDPRFSSGYVIPALWIALWAISHPLGASLGSGLGGWTLDKIGRRYTLAIATTWLFFTPFLSFFSDRLSTVTAGCALYFAGKFLQGIGVGATITVLLAYTSEVLPPSIKGSILALHVPMTLLGNVIGAVACKKATTYKGVQIAMAGQWILLIIPVLLLIFLPESPVWCIRQNRIRQAERGCRRLQGNPKDKNDDIFPRLMEVVAGQENNKAHMEVIAWSELFKTPADRHRTFVVIFTATIPTLLGVPLLSHATLLAENMGMAGSLATTFYLAGSVIGVIGSVLAFFVVPAIGRRPNVIFSAIAITILWLSTGIAGCFLGKNGPPVQQFYSNGTAILDDGAAVYKLTANDNAVTKYIGAAIIIAALFLTLFVWPVSFAISGETSSIRLRAKSLALRGIAENLITVAVGAVLPFLYSTDYANIPGKMGFIFFGTGLIIILVSWFTVPETRGLDSVEIDEIYEKKRS